MYYIYSAYAILLLSFRWHAFGVNLHLYGYDFDKYILLLSFRWHAFRVNLYLYGYDFDFVEFWLYSLYPKLYRLLLPFRWYAVGVNLHLYGDPNWYDRGVYGCFLRKF